ncbi:MAG: response regulator [Parvularculaceae bacterium]
MKTDPEVALGRARSGDFDLILVNMSIEAMDPLRLCSSIRSFEETRMTPILAIVRQGDTRKLVRSLDIGVNDYVSRPVDRNELNARVTTQLRRKRYVDQLRSSFQVSLEMAVTDQLTGLYSPPLSCEPPVGDVRSRLLDRPSAGGDGARHRRPLQVDQR